MLLSDFLAQKDNAHSEQGNPVVACNALYKTEENFNCYLTPSQAIALARTKGDNGTRELLERILLNEEESVDWLEAQLYLIENVGAERYLAEQING